MSPESARLLIERAHDEFVDGNATDPRVQDVRALVRESWDRSLQSDVRPEGLPRLELSSDALDSYRRAHPLSGVIEMIRGLLLPDNDSGVVVAVGDAAGRLLWVEGDTRVRRLTGDMGFVAGANWAESSVGTSAPGPRSRSAAPCRSMAPNTSTAWSRRGRAQRRPSTIPKPGGSSASST